MPLEAPEPVSGQLLVADYQTVFVNAATAIAAKREAERSEDALVGQLRYVSSGTFLNPNTLTTDTQTDITRGSLDAHIKKVQAEQLDSLSSQQLEALLQQDKSLYVGRSVTARVLDAPEPPIEYVWFNRYSGYRNNASKKQMVTGTIQEVLLDQNALILEPPFMSRILNRELKHIVVYVINPHTLTPMVELTLS